MAAWVLRSILIVHRYLGVAIGVVMTLWCLSGFVMMYQGYPQLSQAERAQALAPLDLSACCDVSALDFTNDSRAPDVRLEMLLGDPVLRIVPGPFVPPRRGPVLFDLKTGKAVAELDSTQVLQVAAEYGRRRGIVEAPRLLGAIEVDQWTIQTARRNRPIYQIAFDDAAATSIYVSGKSGEVIQATNRRERVFGWLGAVPHWIYPTILRRNGPLWSDVVIWLSSIGTFLTVTGLYVGVARFLPRRGRGWASPFRGWWYWHHISGLVFGIVTLTWVSSGLLTMNPWGLLEGTGAFEQIAVVRGAPSWSDVKTFLDAVPRLGARAAEFTQVSSQPLGGRLYMIAHGADGRTTRLDSASMPAPLRLREVVEGFQPLAVPIREASLMETWDDFYYEHKNDRELPVFRVVLDDADRTRVYVHHDTGAMLGIDATMRTSRWWRYGLHDFDFAAIRARPVWDVVVGLLLAGTTAVCITGTWLALKRVRLDFRRLKSRMPRSRAIQPEHEPSGLK